MSNRRLPSLFGLVAVATLALAALSPVAAAANASVRVLHASPDAPAVDVWVDGSKVLTNVPFKGISGYLPLPAGAHQVKVVATGTTSPAVIDAGVTVEAGKAYTIAAAGKLVSVAPQVFVDDPMATTGKAMIRVIHLSPDAPAVDVAVKGQAPSAALVKNLVFPKASDYAAVAPATYDLEVRLAGTTTVALPLNGVALAGATNYTVFAVGLAAAGTPAAQALSVVTAVDGTVPVTSTIAAGSASSLPTLFIVAIVLAGLAVAGTSMALRRRLAVAPTRRER